MACCERIATCFMVGSLYKAALLSILGILEGITGCVETVCWYSVDKHQRHVDLRRGIDIVSDMKRIGWYSHNTSGNQFKSLDQLTEIDHSSHLIWPTTININSIQNTRRDRKQIPWSYICCENIVTYSIFNHIRLRRTTLYWHANEYYGREENINIY